MPEQNTALWLAKPGTKFEVGPAPYTSPASDEVVVRTRAVAVNPFDGLPALVFRIVLPWLNYPAVIGSDVAGEIVEVGSGITRFTVGDRVVGHAGSVEKSVNQPAAGAFQHYTVLAQHYGVADPRRPHVRAGRSPAAGLVDSELRSFSTGPARSRAADG